MLAVFDRSEATLSTRLVALALADNAHDDGSNAFPSLATLARKAKISKSTAQRSLDWLEKHCEIVCTGRTLRGVRVWHFTLVQPLAIPVDRTDPGYAPYPDASRRPLIENPQLIGIIGSQYDYPPIDEWIDANCVDAEDVDLFSQLQVRGLRQGDAEHDQALRRWIELRLGRRGK